MASESVCSAEQDACTCEQYAIHLDNGVVPERENTSIQARTPYRG